MNTVEEYIQASPPERQEALTRLRDILRDVLVPLGYEECISYGMIGYTIPHSLYPAGYHCDTSLPLPFVALANQKNSINLYHMGIYTDPELLNWWEDAYKRENIGKLDMGKSCIRFKNTEKIPYSLIGELMTRVPATEWITLYENSLKK